MASLVMSQNIIPPNPSAAAHSLFSAIVVGVSKELKIPVPGW